MKIIKIDDNSYIKEYDNEDKIWYQNGLKHRLDGPAMEWYNGDKEWYQNDLRHRLDGPAMEWYNGDKSWYYEGKEIKCSSKEEFERLIKLRIFW